MAPVPSSLRLFLAIPLPEAVREGLATVQSALRLELPRASYVNPASMHLTLRFLGDAPAALVPRIGEALEALVAAFAPFSIRVSGGGGFPPRRSPRVLWVGLEDQGSLAVLAEAIEAALVGLGLPPADHAFLPHLTLCRLGGLHLPAVPSWLSDLGEKGSFVAHEVVLFQSELLPSGARHVALARFPLRAAPRSSGGDAPTRKADLHGGRE
jgi:RNA 2',3'-cyclic 3'-phosphodiesterase